MNPLTSPAWTTLYNPEFTKPVIEDEPQYLALELSHFTKPSPMDALRHNLWCLQEDVVILQICIERWSEFMSKGQLVARLSEGGLINRFFHWEEHIKKLQLEGSLSEFEQARLNNYVKKLPLLINEFLLKFREELEMQFELDFKIPSYDLTKFEEDIAPSVMFGNSDDRQKVQEIMFIRNETMLQLIEHFHSPSGPSILNEDFAKPDFSETYFPERSEWVRLADIEPEFVRPNRRDIIELTQLMDRWLSNFKRRVQNRRKSYLEKIEQVAKAAKPVIMSEQQSKEIEPPLQKEHEFKQRSDQPEKEQEFKQRSDRLDWRERPATNPGTHFPPLPSLPSSIRKKEASPLPFLKGSIPRPFDSRTLMEKPKEGKRSTSTSGLESWRKPVQSSAPVLSREILEKKIDHFYKLVTDFNNAVSYGSKREGLMDSSHDYAQLFSEEFYNSTTIVIDYLEKQVDKTYNVPHDRMRKFQKNSITYLGMFKEKFIANVDELIRIKNLHPEKAKHLYFHISKIYYPIMAVAKDGFLFSEQADIVNCMREKFESFLKENDVLVMLWEGGGY